MSRDLLHRILLVVGAILLTILMLEFAVRLAGETDADGQFRIGSYSLPPYSLRLNRLRAKLERYFNNKDEATIIPDPETGWTYKPNSERESGGFTINGAGLRALREYALQPADDTLRIALFGDSFVAGDEVRDDEIWAYKLENLLTQARIKAEVLNFGVGGYGMGQAFLRWQSLGKEYSPDVVIFAFQPENLDRNVNVFQLLRIGGIAFSKPRFILEGGRLSLVNSPALPPEELMGVFASFDSHSLAEHEAFYRGRELSSPLWDLSRLAGLLHALRQQLFPPLTPAQIYGPDSERGQLGQEIVAAFAADVAVSGAEFIILHLPRKDHFREFHEGEQMPWQFLLDHFQKNYHFINAVDFLGVKYTDESFYQPGWHYGPEIHSRIAESLAAELLACIENGTCEFARFPDIRSIRRED